MARNRMIKPGFCTNEQLAKCQRDARLMFILMWGFCDDNGIHPAIPLRIKMEVFPGDDDCTEKDIERWIEQLKQNDLLMQYEAEGKSYWIVTGWDHQKIDRPRYIYPLPPENLFKINDKIKNAELFFDEDSTNSRRSVDEYSAHKGKGKERKGRESKDINADAFIFCRFDEFWKVYPVKVGKKDAEAIWKKNKLDNKADDIINDVTIRKAQHEPWIRGYIMHPKRHLSGEHWNDAIIEVPLQKEIDHAGGKRIIESVPERARRQREDERRRAALRNTSEPAGLPPALPRERLAS